MYEFTITNAHLSDVPAIMRLYRDVARIEGGLARVASEISEDYVDGFVRRSCGNGIILVARDASGAIVGEIHGYVVSIQVFAHVLGELTIAVHPSHQGYGIGKAIFSEFLRCVREERPDILRVELIARESNKKAIEFYERLGFRIEGRFEGRIASVGGGFESDIPMAWLRERDASSDSE